MQLKQTEIENNLIKEGKKKGLTNGDTEDHVDERIAELEQLIERATGLEEIQDLER